MQDTNVEDAGKNPNVEVNQSKTSRDQNEVKTRNTRMKERKKNNQKLPGQHTLAKQVI